MSSEETSTQEQKEERPQARPFNPLVNYVYYLMVVAVAFAVQWLLGSWGRYAYFARIFTSPEGSYHQSRLLIDLLRDLGGERDCHCPRLWGCDLAKLRGSDLLDSVVHHGRYLRRGEHQEDVRTVGSQVQRQQVTSHLDRCANAPRDCFHNFLLLGNDLRRYMCEKGPCWRSRLHNPCNFARA